MPKAIKISDKLSVEAKISKCAEENPELTCELINEILLGLEELDNGDRTEYEFGKAL
ncbi:MAG TPA: hypothetical protein PLK90_06850 [Clostridiales bacterium]|nr:hypothetical protein [Clostridiales bacterium]HQP70101.1 hypothetical protein [Clostridiales bacterium]